MSTSTTTGRGEVEAAVRACYSAWSERYYKDYCGPQACVPPVHYGLIRELLAQSQACTVLDAGCGPASLLRELVSPDRELYGFTLAYIGHKMDDRALIEQGLGLMGDDAMATLLNAVWLEK